MTIKEIIDGLKFTVDMFLFNPSTGETYTEPRNDMDKTTIDACKGAIELLEQTRWIPCSERLPKYNTPILLALKQIGKERTIVIGERRTRKSGWYFVDIAAYDTEHEVIAWMPLPQPYTVESEDKE